jgi:hypothetical protein
MTIDSMLFTIDSPIFYLHSNDTYIESKEFLIILPIVNFTICEIMKLSVRTKYF